jgi:hypothetical protein
MACVPAWRQVGEVPHLTTDAESILTRRREAARAQRKRKPSGRWSNPQSEVRQPRRRCSRVGYSFMRLPELSG